MEVRAPYGEISSPEVSGLVQEEKDMRGKGQVCAEGCREIVTLLLSFKLRWPAPWENRSPMIASAIVHQALAD